MGLEVFVQERYKANGRGLGVLEPVQQAFSERLITDSILSLYF